MGCPIEPFTYMVLLLLWYYVSHLCFRLVHLTQSLYVQLVLRFIWDCFKTVHACLLPYENLHIIKAV